MSNTSDSWRLTKAGGALTGSSSSLATRVMSDLSNLGPTEQQIHAEKFFATHPKLFLRAIYQSYSFDEQIIDLFADRLDWKMMSFNLPWPEELIEKYADRWDWELISANEHLPWSEELVDKYADRWDWDNLGGNQGVPWTSSFIARFSKQLIVQSEYLSHDIVNTHTKFFSNPKIPWSSSILEILSGHMEEDHWSAVSTSKHMPWSLALIKKFAHHWEWGTLSKNEAVPISEEMLDQFKEYWDWSYISDRSLPWTDSLIRRFEDYWSYSLLIWNQ